MSLPRASSAVSPGRRCTEDERLMAAVLGQRKRGFVLELQVHSSALLHGVLHGVALHYCTWSCGQVGTRPGERAGSRRGDTESGYPRYTAVL